MAAFDSVFTRHPRMRFNIDRTDLVRMLAVPFLIGFLFGWISDDSDDIGRRLAFATIWGTLSACGWLVNDVITRPLSASLKQFGAPLLVTLLAGFVVAGPFAIILNLSFGDLFREMGFARNGLSMMSQLTFGQYMASAVAPLILWLSINLAAFHWRGHLYSYDRNPQSTETPQAPAKTARPVMDAAGPAFLWKVKPSVRGSIYAIKAELHYVRVYTDRGEDLIHFRFGDAVEALEKLGGVQIHRSWCVMPDFVLTKAARSVVMANNMSVPVGRSYAKAIAAVGAG